MAKTKTQRHEVMGSKVEFTKGDRGFTAHHKGIDITLSIARLGIEPPGTIIALGHFKQGEGGRITLRGAGKTPAQALFEMSEVVRAFRAAIK